MTLPAVTKYFDAAYNERRRAPLGDPAR